MNKKCCSIKIYRSFLFLVKAFLLALPFIFISNSLFAQINITDFNRDVSSTFLEYIFGYVSENFRKVLDGTSMFKSAFAMFNAAISIVGVVIVCYITIVGLVNSAHSGTPMGQRWHSFFLPLRVAMGAVMLIPNPVSGYSFAQVVIMWFILTGINIANNVWLAVIASGTPTQGIFDPTPTSVPPQISGNEIASRLSGLVNFAICVGSSPNYLNDSNLDIGVYFDPGKNQIIPNSTKVSGDNHCSSLALQVDKRLQTSNYTVENVALSTINSIIAAVANDLPVGAVPQHDINGPLGAQIASDVYGLFTVLQGYIARASQQTIVDFNQHASEMAALGWIAAGPLYYKLINQGPGRQQGSPNISDFGTFIKFQIASGLVVGEPSTSLHYVNWVSSEVTNSLAQLVPASAPPGSYGTPTFNPTTVQQVDFDPDIQGADLMKPFDYIYTLIVKIVKELVKWVLDTDNLLGYPEKTNLTSSISLNDTLKEDPIKGIAMQGNHLLVMAEEWMVIALILLLVTGIAVGAVLVAMGLIPPIFAPLTGVGGIAGLGASLTTSAIGILLGIAFGVIFAMIGIFMVFYPLGILMNIYIPFIPLMIWIAGVMGWLMICVEAMVAAPLVAVGLMHPDGNEVIGKAEHGLTMILNLMLRPGLMVMGLIAAIIMVRLGCLFFSWGVNMVLGSEITTIQSAGAIVALSYAYILILMSIIQRSFSIINALPDKVITWVGGAATQTAGEQELVGATREGMQQGGSKLGEGAQAAKGGYAAGKSMAPSGGGASPGGGGGASMTKP